MMLVQHHSPSSKPQHFQISNPPSPIQTIAKNSHPVFVVGRFKPPSSSLDQNEDFTVNLVSPLSRTPQSNSSFCSNFTSPCNSNRNSPFNTPIHSNLNSPLHSPQKSLNCSPFTQNVAASPLDQNKVADAEILKRVGGDITIKLDSGYKTFSLDGVSMAEEESIAAFYNRFVKHKVEDVKYGGHCTVLLYGPTGTGKSYTMFSSKKEEGIVFLALKQIMGLDLNLSLVDDGKSIISKSENSQVLVKATILEIESDEVYDLLGKKPPSKSFFGGHKKGESAKKVKVELRGNKPKKACELEAKDINKFVFDIFASISKRSQKSTKCNDNSSRSHCMVIFDLPNVKGSLTMVDMAGSENIEESGMGNVLVDKRQAAKINEGNLALRRVIEALASKDSHVPYRDSKLTRLLKDSFENERSTVLMILCSSVEKKEINKTINTLEYGAKAKSITYTNLKENSSTKDSMYQKQLQLEAYLRERDEFIKKLKEEDEKNQILIEEKEKETAELRKKMLKLQVEIETERMNQKMEMEREISRAVKSQIENKMKEVNAIKQKMETELMQQKKISENLKIRAERAEMELKKKRDKYMSSSFYQHDGHSSRHATRTVAKSEFDSKNCDEMKDNDENYCNDNNINDNNYDDIDDAFSNYNSIITDSGGMNKNYSNTNAVSNSSHKSRKCVNSMDKNGNKNATLKENDNEKNILRNNNSLTVIKNLNLSKSNALNNTKSKNHSKANSPASSSPPLSSSSSTNKVVGDMNSERNEPNQFKMIQQYDFTSMVNWTMGKLPVINEEGESQITKSLDESDNFDEVNSKIAVNKSENCFILRESESVNEEENLNYKNNEVEETIRGNAKEDDKEIDVGRDCNSDIENNAAANITANSNKNDYVGKSRIDGNVNEINIDEIILNFSGKKDKAMSYISEAKGFSECVEVSIEDKIPECPVHFNIGEEISDVIFENPWNLDQTSLDSEKLCETSPITEASTENRKSIKIGVNVSAKKDSLLSTIPVSECGISEDINDAFSSEARNDDISSGVADPIRFSNVGQRNIFGRGIDSDGTVSCSHDCSRSLENLSNTIGFGEDFSQSVLNFDIKLLHSQELPREKIFVQNGDDKANSKHSISNCLDSFSFSPDANASDSAHRRKIEIPGKVKILCDEEKFNQKLSVSDEFQNFVLPRLKIRKSVQESREGGREGKIEDKTDNNTMDFNSCAKNYLSPENPRASPKFFDFSALNSTLEICTQKFSPSPSPKCPFTTSPINSSLSMSPKTGQSEVGFRSPIQSSKSNEIQRDDSARKHSSAAAVPPVPKSPKQQITWENRVVSPLASPRYSCPLSPKNGSKCFIQGLGECNSPYKVSLSTSRTAQSSFGTSFRSPNGNSSIPTEVRMHSAVPTGTPPKSPKPIKSPVSPYRFPPHQGSTSPEIGKSPSEKLKVSPGVGNNNCSGYNSPFLQRTSSHSSSEFLDFDLNDDFSLDSICPRNLRLSKFTTNSMLSSLTSSSLFSSVKTPERGKSSINENDDTKIFNDFRNSNNASEFIPALSSSPLLMEKHPRAAATSPEKRFPAEISRTFSSIGENSSSDFLLYSSASPVKETAKSLADSDLNESDFSLPKSLEHKALGLFPSGYFFTRATHNFRYDATAQSLESGSEMEVKTENFPEIDKSINKDKKECAPSKGGIKQCDDRKNRKEIQEADLVNQEPISNHEHVEAGDRELNHQETHYQKKLLDQSNNAVQTTENGKCETTAEAEGDIFHIFVEYDENKTRIASIKMKRDARLCELRQKIIPFLPEATMNFCFLALDEIIETDLESELHLITLPIYQGQSNFRLAVLRTY